MTAHMNLLQLNDTIAYNFILANYHSSMSIDNDGELHKYA